MTFNNNYGGMLQGYALMTHLKKTGHNPLLINVKSEKNEYYKLPYTITKRIILKYILKRKDITWVIPEWFLVKRRTIIEQNTRYFIEKYIEPKTKPIYNERQFQKYTKNECDAYIVGSDQVWRPIMYRFINHAFFDFVKDYNIPVLSYAASFGVDKWEYTLEETAKYKQQIKRFKAVSVREDSGVELCSRYLNKKAIQVLDPTFLLSQEDYLNLVNAEKETSNTGEILCYFLDLNKEKKILIKNISDELGLIPFNVNVKATERDSPIYDRIYPSVTSWLKGFIDAKFILTDSFHGCVFSIIFNKPFVTLGNPQRGLSRFKSLLRLFNLESRMIGNLDEFDLSILSEKIDWLFVNETIKKERQKSNKFLMDALNVNISINYLDEI